MVCALCSAARLSTPAPPEPLFPHSASANQLLVRIDRWYASSKVCSGCGNRKAELSLSMREYRCHACGLVMGRDENAAKNIETEAARSADSLNGRGDEVIPFQSERAI